MYMRPFFLNVFFSKKFIIAKVMHRSTSKVISVTTTNAKALRNLFAVEDEPRKDERIKGKLLDIIMSATKQNYKELGGDEGCEGGEGRAGRRLGGREVRGGGEKEKGQKERKERRISKKIWVLILNLGRNCLRQAAFTLRTRFL
ncbi:hypothetical protein Droror1_Dr00012465 [Drosera rotundifolia]